MSVPLIVRPLLLAFSVALAGCAIRTPARHGIAPPAPGPFELDVVPGTGEAVVPRVAQALGGTVQETADIGAKGILSHVDQDDVPLEWQFRAREDSALFWRTDAKTVHIVHCWNANYSGAIAARMGSLFEASDHDVPGTLLDKAADAEPRIKIDHGLIENAELEETQQPAKSIAMTRCELHCNGDVADAAGIAFVVSGLGAPVPGERTIIRRLTDRNWCVIHMWSPTMDKDSVLRGFGATIPKQAGTKKKTYTPQQLPEAVIPLFDASGLAGLTDTILMASVRTAMDIKRELYRQHPHLRSAPRVLIGVSYGAIATPAIAAATDPPTCAVLVAGGVNIAESLGQFSGVHRMLEDSWVPNAGTTRRSRALRRRMLNSLFLDACALDPYHWAPALADTPVLQLHARWDAIVPARSGTQLNERLGQPELWTYPVGHIGMMFILGMQADRIVQWIDTTVADARERMVAQ